MFYLVVLGLLTIKSISQEIPKAPKNKAVVYFVRTSAFGAIVNFTYFDSTTVIAKTNGTNYVRYECEPGPHLFWAKSENIDFVEAELEAEKIYFLEAVPKMGITRAEVELRPVNFSNEKTMDRIYKLMNKKSPAITEDIKLEREIERNQNTGKETLEKYKKAKEAGRKIDRLEKDMYYKN